MDKQKLLCGYFLGRPADFDSGLCCSKLMTIFRDRALACFSLSKSRVLNLQRLHGNPKITEPQTPRHHAVVLTNKTIATYRHI